ncbi:MAG: pyridoxine 5'-phosphate synthase, partial [Leptospiraceae bacterium]|nr:pyridoxine 5'-phosphate synthase [Leptospiraceae bacterium]
MIHLSVNVNKIATLRNSRGGAIPDLLYFSGLALRAGAHGITVHPREDERHIRKEDVFNLKDFLEMYNSHGNVDVEYNLEGEPEKRFIDICLEVLPEQATLVPVTPGEITSDHGFQFKKDKEKLKPAIEKLKEKGIRVSLFVDAGVENLYLAKELGADRIELYTGPFAELYDLGGREKAFEIFQTYLQTAREAKELGLGINAGHDLDHLN